MYNKLREKVNLLLEDNCEFQTAQESFNKPKQERIAGLFSDTTLKTEFDEVHPLRKAIPYRRMMKEILPQTF